jgi:hypothetical protein
LQRDQIKPACRGEAEAEDGEEGVDVEEEEEGDRE